MSISFTGWGKIASEVDQSVIDEEYRYAFLTAYAATGLKIVHVVPAILMERIANQRLTHNKYHLSLGHARAQLIDHLLSDDVSLGNGNLVNTREVHVADVATGNQCRRQGKKNAVSY